MCNRTTTNLTRDIRFFTLCCSNLKERRAKFVYCIPVLHSAFTASTSYGQLCLLIRLASFSLAAVHRAKRLAASWHSTNKSPSSFQPYEKPCRRCINRRGREWQPGDMLTDAHLFSAMNFHSQIYSTAFPCNVVMEQCWVTESYAILQVLAADTNSSRVTLYCRSPWTPQLHTTYTGFGPALRIGLTKAIAANDYDELDCAYGILLNEHYRCTPGIHVEFDACGDIVSMREHTGLGDEVIGIHIVHTALAELASATPNMTAGFLVKRVTATYLWSIALRMGQYCVCKTVNFKMRCMLLVAHILDSCTWYLCNAKWITCAWCGRSVAALTNTRRVRRPCCVFPCLVCKSLHLTVGDVTHDVSSWCCIDVTHAWSSSNASGSVISIYPFVFHFSNVNNIYIYI